jgi:hypothetical protein
VIPLVRSPGLVLVDQRGALTVVTHPRHEILQGSAAVIRELIPVCLRSWKCKPSRPTVPHRASRVRRSPRRPADEGTGRSAIVPRIAQRRRADAVIPLWLSFRVDGRVPAIRGRFRTVRRVDGSGPATGG